MLQFQVKRQIQIILIVLNVSRNREPGRKYIRILTKIKYEWWEF